MAILKEKYYGDLNCRTQHRMIKYLNNIVEQDHRFIKKKTKQMLGLKSFKTAKKTISGIEIMHMIRSGQVEVIQGAHSEVECISDLMVDAVKILNLARMSFIFKHFYTRAIFNNDHLCKRD